MTDEENIQKENLELENNSKLPEQEVSDTDFSPRNKNPRRSPRSSSGRKNIKPERVKPEFDQKIISIRRVTRVVSGGRRMSFAVAVVVGNKKGSVGIGTGKAGDTSLAIDKAYNDGKKRIIKIPLTKKMSLAHDVSAKYKSARLSIFPARGKGLIAGSSVRDVLELAGIKDVNAKLISPTKNKLNNARVTLKALLTLKPTKVK